MLIKEMLVTAFVIVALNWKEFMYDSSNYVLGTVLDQQKSSGKQGSKWNQVNYTITENEYL